MFCLWCVFISWIIILVSFIFFVDPVVYWISLCCGSPKQTFICISYLWKPIKASIRKTQDYFSSQSSRIVVTGKAAFSATQFQVSSSDDILISYISKDMNFCEASGIHICVYKFTYRNKFSSVATKVDRSIPASWGNHRSSLP